MTKIPKEIEQLREDANTQVVIDLSEDRFEVRTKDRFELDMPFSEWAKVIKMPYDELKELTENNPAATALASLDFIAPDVQAEFGKSPFDHQQVVALFFYPADEEDAAQIMGIEYTGALATSAKPTIH